MQQKKNITLKDIALRAGISINAVSRALRDSPDISESTKERVRKIATELGYVPDSVARSLKNDNSKIVALVYNDFYNPYFAIYCEKVFHYIKEKGYKCNLIYSDTNLMTMNDIENIMINRYCGVISFVEPTTDVALFFKKREIPFCLVGINSNVEYIDCIYTDDIDGGKQVGNYFVQNEFTKALYLTNSISETSFRRFLGFSEVVNASNKPFSFIPYQYQKDFIQIAYKKIVSEDIDFVFCFSDSLAIELISYLKQKRMKKKIKIIGYDDIHQFYPIFKNVDSVRTDTEEIVHFACDLIIDKVTQEKNINEYFTKMFPTYLHIIKE